MASNFAYWAVVAFFGIGALGGWMITIMFAVEVVKGWKSRKHRAF